MVIPFCNHPVLMCVFPVLGGLDPKESGSDDGLWFRASLVSQCSGQSADWSGQVPPAPQKTHRGGPKQHKGLIGNMPRKSPKDGDLSLKKWFTPPTERRFTCFAKTENNDEPADVGYLIFKQTQPPRHALVWLWVLRFNPNWWGSKLNPRGWGPQWYEETTTSSTEFYTHTHTPTHGSTHAQGHKHSDRQWQTKTQTHTHTHTHGHRHRHKHRHTNTNT